jgi:hypothetical protein
MGSNGAMRVYTAHYKLFLCIPSLLVVMVLEGFSSSQRMKKKQHQKLMW